MSEIIKKEIELIKAKDPAARSSLEVYFLYPGFRALKSYRKAHRLYEKKHYFLARWVSERAKRKTGIEIHPAAKIGEGLFIDHGTGVVIGETVEIGNNCLLYQGVTLGGTGKDKGKRHPTLGNNVLVGAGAKVLGPVNIGDNAKIAAGAVVLCDVPPNSTAVGVPAKIVVRDGVRIASNEIDQVHIPDPISQEISRLEARIEELEKKSK